MAFDTNYNGKIENATDADFQMVSNEASSWESNGSSFVVNRLLYDTNEDKIFFDLSYVGSSTYNGGRNAINNLRSSVGSQLSSGAVAYDESFRIEYTTT